MTLVVDASSLVDYLLRGTPETGAILRAEGLDIHAPEVIDLELASAVRSLLLSGVLAEDRMRMLISDYLDLPVALHRHRPLLARIFELRHNFSSYDAAYLALAETLGARFLTGDARLARAAGVHTALEVCVVS